MGSAAEAKPGDYTARIVTFSTLESRAARGAMLTAPGQENMLVKELAPDMASPLSDIILRCRAGQSSIDAISETPYTTEYDINSEWRQLVPSSFTFRNTGTGARVKVQPSTETEPAILSYYWDRTRYAGRKLFPVLTVKTFTPVVQPVFFTEMISGKLTVANGQWRLAGMTRPLELSTGATNAQRTLMTFVKVWDGTPAVAAPAPVEESRLHLLAFCVPVREGIDIAQRPAGSDEELLEDLMDRAVSGETILTSHAACVVRRSGKEAPVSPPANDFFACSQGSNAESIHEDSYATEFNPDPKSFSFRNAGHVLRTTQPDKAQPSLTAIHWESLDGAATQMPLSPQPGADSMIAPEYSPESLDLQVDIPPGTARLVGAMLQPDDGGPRMMHLYFLKSAGPSPKSPAAPAGL